MRLLTALRVLLLRIIIRVEVCRRVRLIVPLRSVCVKREAFQHGRGQNLTEEEAAQGMTLEWVDSFDEAVCRIENAKNVDEDGSEVGLKMMKLREIAILRRAQEIL